MTKSIYPCRWDHLSLIISWRLVLGLMLPAPSPTASLCGVYNPKMGDGDGTHISFYRSAGDNSLSVGVYMQRGDKMG